MKKVTKLKFELKNDIRQIIKESIKNLQEYSENQNFKGWDPFDGLSSELFKCFLFARKNRFARLVWIQLFKRSPINLRIITGVHKVFNAKGLALFLSGYCNLSTIYSKQNEEVFLTIQFLYKEIINQGNNKYSGNCWGYYFPWQARAFYQLPGTPNAVTTCFVANSLLDFYEINKEQSILDRVTSSTNFLLNDLEKTIDSEGNFSVSYSPLDSTQVFNVSFLVARLLARIYSLTGNFELFENSRKLIQYCVKYQNIDGSWAYSALDFHNWIDSFHTGFNLECLYEYMQYTGNKRFEINFEKGMQFYINNFFTEKGESKYYHNKLYPIDIHAPAQLIVTLVKTKQYLKYEKIANSVLIWTIQNMQSPKGYFYYRKYKYFTNKIPYMRWSNAWMFYAMSLLLKELEIK